MSKKNDYVEFCIQWDYLGSQMEVVVFDHVHDERGQRAPRTIGSFAPGSRFRVEFDGEKRVIEEL